MNILSAENVSKSFTEKVLFENLSFGVSKGQRVALVGINGCGKSTFLNVLGGKLQPDTGAVSIRKGTMTAFLGQNFDFNQELSIEENIFDTANEKHKIVKEYEVAVVDPNVDSDYLQELMEKMDQYNLWDFDSSIKQILSALEITNLELPISALSGGQLKRVALAKVLMQEPDLLILDEPTNHLDIKVIEWLEKYLSNMTVIMVTHDRYFLDNVATDIVEMDMGTLFYYKGNYEYFLQKKAEREEQMMVEADRAKNILRRELEWMRRQPKARGTKSKSRIEAFYEWQKKAKTPEFAGKVELDMKQTRQGGKILEVDKLSKKYDGLVIADEFSYIFRKGDKIGIVGPNGVGKSTFLHMLTGEEPFDSGTIDAGTTTIFGHFKQQDLFYSPEDRVIDIVKNIAENIEQPDGSSMSASNFLTKFLFPPAVQYSPVHKLSGGEKKRLQLLLTLIKNPNFLILDEPTNDLDIMTLNVLEDFLQAYKGSLIIVSHDRYFMDNLVEHLFIFEGNGIITDFPGNYTDYREYVEEVEALKAQEDKKVKPADSSKTETSNAKKLSFKEQKEFEQLEAEIEEFNAKKEKLALKLSEGNLEYAEIQPIADELKKITEQLEEKELKWLEYSERV